MRSGKTLTAILFTYAVTILLATGCIFFDDGDFNQIYFSGSVRAAADSSAVPGARLTFEVISTPDSQEDQTCSAADGSYAQQLTIPVNALSSQVDQREWLVTVEDADGDSNGVFAPMDTVLVEYDPPHHLETRFELDFHVLMDSTGR